MNPVFCFLSSLRLTVVLLALSCLLVFFGTLDQAHWGIHEAQKRYFESFLVFWQYPMQWIGGDSLRWLHIPLPGGFLLGGLLLINLVCAHFRYFKPGWGKSGIVMIHAGVVLLILSGFLTAFLQRESQMFLDEGGPAVNYSTNFRDNEIVFIDRSAEGVDRVTSIPQSLLIPGERFDLPGTDLQMRVLAFLPNSGAALGPQLLRHYESLLEGTQMPPEQQREISQAIANLRRGDALVLGIEGQTLMLKGDLPMRGFAERMNGVLQAQPPIYTETQANIPGAVVLIESPQETLGAWILSSGFTDNVPAQTFMHDGREYEIGLRFRRYYKPFALSLLEFSHDKYPGTDIPMNFSSDIILDHPELGEHRRVLIYMNNPLRYGGLTFFQQSFANDDTTSILMVVKNPAWTMPYLAVALVGLGMAFQFTLHLIRFARRRTNTGGDQ